MKTIAHLKLIALAVTLLINAPGNAVGDDPNETKLIGYIDTSGTVVIEPAFIAANDFSEGLAGVVPKDSDLYGIIDEDGKMVVPPRFPYIGLFSHGLAPAEDKSGRVGFVDKNGDFVIPPQYYDADEFSEGLAAITVREMRDKRPLRKRGFVDTSGKLAIPPQFDQVGEFSEGKALVERDKRWNYIDKNGRLLMEEWVDYAYEFTENRGPIKKNGLWEFISSDGEMVIAPSFDYVTSFHNGHAIVGLKEGREGRIIDTTGRFSTDRIFSALGEFHEGVALFRDGGALQGIDTRGKTVIGPEKLADVDNLPDFHEGLAAVLIKGRYGYMNKAGEVVIKPQPSFVQAENFSCGRARVTAGRNVLWIERVLPIRKNAE